MKKFFLFAWLCLSGIPSFSQGIPDLKLLAPSDYLPQTPTAASLGQYVDQKVDLSTGVPEITIPLYTVNTGDYELPITLSYHAGGHQVQAGASWVGLGWSLSAGGVINRNIRSLEDKSASNVNSYIAFKNRPGGMLLDQNVADDYILLSKISNRLVDTAPDVYSFTIPGASGKFMMLEDVVMIPSQPIKVSGTVSNPQNFTLTDSKGTQYMFWEPDAERAYNKSGGTGEPTIRKTAFMLSQILTPNRKPISFYYKDSEFIQDFGGMYTMEYRQTGSSYNPISPTAQWSGTNSVSYGKTLTSIAWDGGTVVFISSNTRDDVVNGTGIGDYKLDDIEVYNNHTLVKKYHFEYGYFSSGSTNAHRRLKLQSLTEVDINGNGKDIVQTFVYNEAVNLPSRSSFKYDHWGYFNNKGQELPTLMQNGTVDLSTKEPDLAYAQANILTDIIHPTKGKTSFEYELNQYYAGSYEYKQINIGCLAIDSSLTVGNSDTDIQNFYLPSNAEDISIVLTTQVVENMGTNNYVELNYQDDILWYWDQRHNQTHTLSSRQPGYYTLKCAIDNGKSYAQATGTVSYKVATYTRNGGGLRVKTIRKTAFDGSPSMVTKYSYKTGNGHSTGVLLKSMPAYIRNRTEYISQYNPGDLLWCTGVPYNNVIIYTGLTPADFAPSPVGYHTVTVSRGDNDENGKTVHTFRMSSYGLNDVGWMFGQPLTENNYRADGTLLSSLENIYTVVNDNVPGVTALSAEQIGSHYCAEDYTFNHSYPRQYEQTYSTAIQGWVRLDKTIVTNYHPEPSGTQTSFAKTTDYTYDAYHQVNSIVEDAGNNQKLITEFEYPQGRPDPVFVQMKNENRVSDVILKRQIQQNGSDVSSRKMLSASYVKYANVPVGSVNVPKVESQYVLETLAPVNVMTSVPEGPCTQLPCFEKQITMQYSSPALDPVLVTDKTNQKFTMVWGFHHDLIAQVVNATPDQVAYSSMERESQNWILGGWTVLVPTPNAEISFPVAKTGKYCATQIRIGKTNLPPGQYHLSYHVRGNGSINVNGTTTSVNEADWKYNITKVTVTSTADVVSLQANEGVFIDEVRLYPVGASMKTFWSEIMVGVKSITDENGVTSYFQYDGLNRLDHITDDKRSIIQSFEYNLKK